MDATTHTIRAAAPSGGSAPRQRSGKPLKKRRDETPDSRRRFSITLSPKSTEAFEWLKEFTDADTDSEVIRNALRVHYVLLQQATTGNEFFVCKAGHPEKMTKIDLFVTK